MNIFIYKEDIFSMWPKPLSLHDKYLGFRNQKQNKHWLTSVFYRKIVSLACPLYLKSDRWKWFFLLFLLLLRSLLFLYDHYFTFIIIIIYSCSNISSSYSGVKHEKVYLYNNMLRKNKLSKWRFKEMNIHYFHGKELCQFYMCSPSHCGPILIQKNLLP